MNQNGKAKKQTYMKILISTLLHKNLTNLSPLSIFLERGWGEVGFIEEIYIKI